MELSFPNSAHPRLSSSATAYHYYFNPCHSPFLRPSPRPRGILANSAKKRRSSEVLLPLKEQKRSLSKILREEAAVLNVERKAGSAKRTNLWPKAVLEALDDAISNYQWDSALKQRWYQPKSQTYAKLVTMLGKCRQTEHARLLFQIMFSEGLKPSLDVYTSLIANSDSLIRSLHCSPKFSYLGIKCTTVTYNAIIDGYGKAGMLEEMESSLSNMLETGSCLPDVVTMNSIIWAYGNNGRIIEMESWYDQFQHMGVEPDVTTFNILVKSYGKAAMYEKMGLVIKFMKKRFFSPTTVTFNIIIECFGREKNIEKMEYYFRLMKIQGIKPNSITFCSLVSAYGKAGFLEKVPAMIRQTENSDVVLDAAFFNCVINAYGQAGDINIMEEMFLLMKEKECKPDSITYATMIQAYRRMAMDETAQELETEMNNQKTNTLEPG